MPAPTASKRVEGSMDRLMRWVMLFLLMVPVAVAAEVFSGIGFVNEDGSLTVASRTVHLYGIYIPETDETCHTFVRPVRCGPRAVLALKFRITGFVRCAERLRRPDGSIEAVCRTGGDAFEPGEDLSAHLLRYGWAVARPYAPFEYHALERIARHRGVGIWGIPMIR